MKPPLHCPIDFTVLTWIEWVDPPWTSPKFNREEYQKAIKLCEMKAVGQNLSEWELFEFNARNERSPSVEVKKCLCTISWCAKCLSTNCEDNDCKIHTRTAKENWRRNNMKNKSVDKPGREKSEKDLHVN